MRMRLPKFVRRNESGSVAIEFALIAPVFFLLCFAILETGMMFLANVTLENAVKESGRVIRTGQAAARQMTQQQFRDDLCIRIDFMLSCDAAELLIDVRAFSNFGGSSFPPPLDAQGNLNPNLNNFQPGASSQNQGQNSTILVRAFYKWPLFTPMFGRYLENMGSGSGIRLISSSVAFKNEPF